MPRLNKSVRKRQLLLQKALDAVTLGCTIRQGAEISGLPLSTFFYHTRRTEANPSNMTYSRTQLTEEEELCIVKMLKEFAAKVNPLLKSDIAEAAELLFCTLPAERQAKMKWASGRPGRKFVELFLKRHQNEIHLGRPSMEEEVRWRSSNANVITTHIAALEKIIKDNGITASHIANLDETGVSPNRDVTGRIQAKQVLNKNRKSVRANPVQRMAYFKDVKRVTMLPTIFANGDCGRPLFITQGGSMPWREVVRGNRYEMETIFECLPRGSLATTRDTVAGVTKFSFELWAEYFVRDVADKTTNGRKILLTYDGYRSHLGVKVLDTLRKGNVLCYCLPAHISGITQPLDVGIFGPFKAHLNKKMHHAAKAFTYEDPTFDLFDLLQLMKDAYESSFTRQNICSAFAKSGLWPIDVGPLISVPRPRSADAHSEMVDVDELRALFEAKREAALQDSVLQPVVVRRGYVDTRLGLLLTTEEAMHAARAQEASSRAKYLEKKARDAAKETREETARAKIRAAREAFEARRQAYRVRMYKDPDQKPRSLAVRRAIAKQRTIARRATQVDIQ